MHIMGVSNFAIFVCLNLFIHRKQWDRQLSAITMPGKTKVVGLYLLKMYTGLTNRQIGQQFGNISYSGVAKVYKRFSEELGKDKALRKNVEGIISNLSLVKG